MGGKGALGLERVVGRHIPQFSARVGGHPVWLSCKATKQSPMSRSGATALRVTGTIRMVCCFVAAMSDGGWYCPLTLENDEPRDQPGYRCRTRETPMDPSRVSDLNVSRVLRLSAFLTVAALIGVVTGCSESKPKVVLYSAQDPEFAEEVLPEFTQQTGIHVATKYDTEANKSVSLYAELIQEKNRPRCDVHWNNEILATIRLQREGLLEPYESPAAATYPAWTKAKDHTWQAFASRARVLLVNTQMVPDPKKRPHSLLDLTDSRWKGKVGMAKPQFGTTATQAACLFEVLGSEKAKEFYRGLKKNGVQLVAGNKQAAQGVSQGQFAVGMTDTDDAIIEVLAGRPVTIILPDRDGHPDHPRMGTLFIPNTLAVIRACPNPEGARKLVDYLLVRPWRRSWPSRRVTRFLSTPTSRPRCPKRSNAHRVRAGQSSPCKWTSRRQPTFGRRCSRSCATRSPEIDIFEDNELPVSDSVEQYTVTVEDRGVGGTQRFRPSRSMSSRHCGSS